MKSTDIFGEIYRLRAEVDQLWQIIEDQKRKLSRLEDKMLELKPELNKP